MLNKILITAGRWLLKTVLTPAYVIQFVNWLLQKANNWVDKLGKV